MTEKILNLPNKCTEIIYVSLTNSGGIYFSLKLNLVQDLKKYIKDFKLERAIEEYNTVEEKFNCLEYEGVLDELHDCYIGYINIFIEECVTTVNKPCTEFLSSVLDLFLEEVDFAFLVRIIVKDYLEDPYNDDYYVPETYSYRLGKRDD
jgi:hypothetical protein